MGNRYGVGNPAYDGLNRLTQFNGAAIQHDLLGNRLQDGKWVYVWDALNRLVGMNPNADNPDNRLYSFVYRADGLRVKKVWHTPMEVAPAEALASGPSKVRTEEEEAKPVYIGHEVDYLYDGQMPVCEQAFEDGVLQQTRVNFLGARGIEAVLTIDHTRGNQVALRWLLYDGHGNLVRLMAPDYTLSAFQWRGVWGEVQGSLGAGRGYCANLGHPEDETGLVYMRARYYEPATGRFISEDPARDGVNWYLYADGNPVNRVDQGGQIDFPEWLQVLMAVGTILGSLLTSKVFRGVFVAAMSALLIPLGVFGVLWGAICNDKTGAIPLFLAWEGLKWGYNMAVSALVALPPAGFIGEVIGLVLGALALLWLVDWTLNKLEEQGS
jgi:RHS repeat-associated protein